MTTFFFFFLKPESWVIVSTCSGRNGTGPRSILGTRKLRLVPVN